MKSLNIRLTPEVARAVASLQSAGANVSEIVRASLLAAADKAKPSRPRTVKDVRKILAELDKKYPGPPPEWVQMGVDIKDRRQVRTYLDQKMRRKLARKAA